MTLLELKLQNREYKKYLTGLVNACENYIKAIDEEMQKPSSGERGKRIATLTNQLNYSKDMAKHFGLGKKLGR